MRLLVRTVILNDLLKQEMYEDCDLNTLRISKKYKWICKRYNHIWHAKLCNRMRGDNCPYCSGRKLLTGFNDLETVNPRLANLIIDDDPKHISYATDKKYKFSLLCGHEILDSPKIISARNEWCYYCSGRRVLRGFNSVFDKEKQVIKYWDTEANIINPDEVHYGSNRVLHWFCSAGHKWTKRLQNQIKANYCNSCNPYNGKKKLLSKTKHAQEIDHLRNSSENINTNLLTVGSHKLVNWICVKKKHKYKTSVKIE